MADALVTVVIHMPRWRVTGLREGASLTFAKESSAIASTRSLHHHSHLFLVILHLACLSPYPRARAASVSRAWYLRCNTRSNVKPRRSWSTRPFGSAHSSWHMIASCGRPSATCAKSTQTSSSGCKLWSPTSQVRAWDSSPHAGEPDTLHNTQESQTRVCMRVPRHRGQPE
jgi:hypothetical protein